MTKTQKMLVIAKKITDHDNYVTTPQFNQLTKENLF